MQISSQFTDERSEVHGDELICPRLKNFGFGYRDFTFLVSRTVKKKKKKTLSFCALSHSVEYFLP